MKKENNKTIITVDEIIYKMLQSLSYSVTVIMMLYRNNKNKFSKYLSAVVIEFKQFIQLIKKPQYSLTIGVLVILYIRNCLYNSRIIFQFFHFL